MTHFIELKQIYNTEGALITRKINVSVEQICFYYDNHLVFNNRAIDVKESYEVITEKINNVMKGE